jgi:hypothetical protein
VHIWGPIIAGTGTGGAGGILKGDLRPGSDMR